MLTEEQLHLHLRGRGHPGSHGFHETDVHIPHRSHEVAAFLDGQHESSSILASMRAAVSLGGPTVRRQHGMRDRTSLKIMSLKVRRAGATPQEQYEISGTVIDRRMSGSPKVKVKGVRDGRSVNPFRKYTALVRTGRAGWWGKSSAMRYGKLHSSSANGRSSFSDGPRSAASSCPRGPGRSCAV